MHDVTHLRDETMAMDCLFSCKMEVARDAYSIIDADHPRIRQMFERMATEHLRMQYEIWNFAHRHGWYDVPPASQETLRQIWPRSAQGARTVSPGENGYTSEEYPAGYGAFGTAQGASRYGFEMSGELTPEEPIYRPASPQQEGRRLRQEEDKK